MRLSLRFARDALHSVRLAVGLLLLVLGRRSILALVIVDIATKLETKIALGRGAGSSAVGSWERLARYNGRLWTRLEGLQSSRGIGDDTEVAGERRADVGWASLRVDLRMSISVPEDETIRLLT